MSCWNDPAGGQLAHSGLRWAAVRLQLAVNSKSGYVASQPFSMRTAAKAAFPSPLPNELCKND